MSETIDRMLAEAREKARAPSRRWWDRPRREAAPLLHREALEVVGVPPSDGPSYNRLLAIVAAAFPWEGYIESHCRISPDPLTNMVKNLREAGVGF